MSHLAHRAILCHWQFDWQDAEEEAEFKSISLRPCSQVGDSESGSKSLTGKHSLSTKHVTNTGPCGAGVENMYQVLSHAQHINVVSVLAYACLDNKPDTVLTISPPVQGYRCSVPDAHV